ncbi:MAG: S8 family serine peptidase [Acidimicrobiales bacterium]
MATRRGMASTGVGSVLRKALVVPLLGAGLLVPVLEGSSAASSAAKAATPFPLAPAWKYASGAMPSRPKSCPPLTAGTTASVANAMHHSAHDTSSLTGIPLWPAPPPTANPEDYAANDHTAKAAPPIVPLNFDTDGNNWKLTSLRNPVTSVSSNPQELCGVEGNSVDSAWQTTTGRPTTVIAVLDSGIEWCDAGIVDKIALNRNALPPPENAEGQTKAELEGLGQKFLDNDPYDLNDTGILDVSQYANDPRVAAVAAKYAVAGQYGGYFCQDPANQDGSYTGISPEDLIRTFADETLPGGAKNPYAISTQSPTGFTGAIAGWNFVDNNDDPYDDVHYGHGTGEAEDMAGSADSTSAEVGACPDCMIMPVRVGTSFITTGNAFADGVLFAVDSGATVVSEALGTTDETPTDTEAIEYAAHNQVPIVGSAADEESEHPNLPAAASDDIIDVNSTTEETSWSPPSSLYLNGCTNYGPAIDLTVESASCSSEATGKTSGTVGLIESEAATAVAEGKMAPSGYLSATGQPVPLSANEVKQILTMSADDVNFTTAAPDAKPPAPKDNFTVSNTGIPLGTTTMYPTTKGYDIYTGWGRLDAARAVQWVSEGRVPPQSLIDSPTSLMTFDSQQSVLLTGMVGAPRQGAVRYQVDVGIGAAPADNQWHLVAQGKAPAGGETGALASISMARLAAMFAAAHKSITGGPVTSTGQPNDDRFTFSIRLLVLNKAGLVGVSQQADFLHDDPSLLPGFPWHFSSSLVASERLAPIGPGGEEVLLVPQSDGTISAYLPDHKELPGWPVETHLFYVHGRERAFASHAVTSPPRGEVIGGIAVGDLADSGGRSLDVVATDAMGYMYAWNSKGQLLPGWPAHVNPAFSEPAARNANNRLLPGIVSAPSLADLQGNGQLDVVAASEDRHVYAIKPDGQPVPGWPVLVVDPSEVQSVDPTTNQITFKPTANPDMGSELVDTPAIGNLSGGTGPPDVVVGADEEYAGTANADLGDLGIAIGSDLNISNSRVYAIEPDGSLHHPASGAPDPTGMPDPGAFVPGWPVAIADLDANLLPTIGDGVVGSPALASLNGGKQLEVVTGSVAGPIYELNANGSSYLGDTGGVPNVTAWVPSDTNVFADLLGATIPALGSPVAGHLGTISGSPVSIAAPASSVGRLLDEAYPGEQTPNDNQVATWSSAKGKMDDGSPDLMNDLQFVAAPLMADIMGNGQDELVETSGLYDLRAYTSKGTELPGYPKFTGGWVLYGPVLGPFGKNSYQALVVGNRAGELFAWSTKASACNSGGSWPQEHHDLWNTSNLSVPFTPPPGCI